MAAKKAIFVVFVSVMGLVSLAGVFSYTRGGASAAANNNLNFQARLLGSTGSLVADGSYNIEFNLYTAPTGGTTQWTEDYLVSATQGVTIKNGYFSVNLGAVTAFPNTIAWDQQQYLGMTVRGTGSCAFAACTPADAEMTPRFKLTAVPYAFRAAKLMDSTNTNAFTADDLIQKAPSVIQTLSSAVAGIRLNQTSTGGLLQLQNSSTDVLTVGNDGAVLAKNKTNGTAAFDIQDSSSNSFLKVNTSGNQATFGSSVGSSKTVLQAGTSGVQITSGANITLGVADANATLLVIDSSSGGDPGAASNGSMYYNTLTNKFRCYENSTWVDCIGGSQSTTGTISFTSGIQNVAANSTGTNVSLLNWTASTTISNVTGPTSFTAAAAGSFRSCLVTDNANITAGTLALRWRVNGVSVGSAICSMDSTTNRQASGVLNPGVVTFNAGDLISVAFDTSAGFLPTGTNDFTVFWSVDYGTWGGGGGGSAATLQNAYDNSTVASILTTNSKDIKFNLADTATDSSFLVDIATGSTGRFAVQSNGTDVFNVKSSGDIVATGGLTIGNNTGTVAGTIRWNGSDFEGYNGSLWKSLTSGSGGGGAAAGVQVHKIKPSNQTSANNTFINDPDLAFSIGANESYTYRFVIQANVNATPDIKFAVTAPTGATCSYGYQDVETAASQANYACGVSTGIVTGNTTDDVYEIVGTVRNGTTAGTVQLQWSQNTTNAGTPITVYAGSSLDAFQTIGTGSNGTPFVQGGNGFGVTGVLGTTDSNDLSVITNSSERIRITAGGNVGIGAGTTPSALLSVGTGSAFQVNSAGNILTSGTLNVTGLSTFNSSLVGNGTATATTGTTSATPGSNTATVVLTAAGSFANNDVIFINNAGQDYYTRIISGAGTTTLTVSPKVSYDASAPVTKYTIQNVGATASDYTTQGNRLFQGYFLGGVVVGAGSTTLSDGNLSRTTGDITLQPGTGGVVQVNGTIDATTINATTITGDGSALTNINGAAITGGSVADASLSSNVVLLTGAQTLTGVKTFSANTSFTGAGTGLSVTNDASVGGALVVAGNTSLYGDTTIGNASTDRLSITSQVLGATALVFQGATDNAFATSFALIDPTANRTITLPDADGTVAVSASGNIALSAAGNITLTGQVPLANGGTGTTTAQGAINALAGLTTTGDLLYYNGTNVTRLARGSNGDCLTTAGGTLSWASCTAGSVTAIGAIDTGTYSANGASIAGSTIYLQTADATHTGLINASAQNIGGVKTFADGLTLTTGKTLTVNGDALTDLTGSNLTNASGALGVVNNPSFTTSVTSPSFTGTGAVTLSSGGAADLTLDSASNVLVLSDATLRRTAAGTTALQLNDTANTVFSITNTNGTAVAGLSVEGSVTAASFSGDGSALTSLTAANLTGTINDARLSTNVALLTGAQTFSGLKTFGGGLTITTGQTLTVNGDAFTDLTGTGLTIASGALQTTLGTSVDLASEINGTLALGNGGTNATTAQGAINNLAGLTTTGDLLYYNGTNASRLARGSNGDCLTTAGGTLSWASCTTGSVTGVGAIDTGTYSANGASVSGSTIYLQTADATHTGLVNATAQSIGGVKTFADGLTLTAGKTLTINGDALTDLTGTGLTNSSGALSVAYGASAGQAVQGNTVLNCPSGTGNLSGGGTVIALGSGGTCANITTNNAVAFTTSVTSPSFTGTGAVTLSSGGTSDLTLDSASNILVLSDATLRRTAAGGTALQLNDTANTTFTITNTDGTAVAGLSVEGGITAASFIGDGSGLTNVGAGNLSGSIADARLSNNVALLTGAQTFSGLKTFGGGLTITTGQNFTVNGDVLTDLTGTNLTNASGALSIVNNPSFSTSITTPTLISTAGLTIDSGNNTLSIASSDTTLQRTAAGTYTIDLNDAAGTTLTLTNSGTGAADLNLAEGGLITAGTSRLTNGGALQNINGLTVASGGASITGTATFVNNIAANGNTALGDATTDRLTITSQILSANALVFQGATDDAFTTTFALTDPTANRTITVPNESGTITLIGPGAAQIDTSTNSSLFINKTGASGNILTLQKSGTGVFTVGNDGSTTIHTTSATALLIDNASGTDYFMVDTSGNLVRVGDPTADATGTVLILDTKNTAADPTGASAVNGAQYYNSALQQYRCYREVAWETCGLKPVDRAYSISDEFMSGYVTCGVGTALVGGENWACNSSGIATLTYNAGTVLPSADHPGIMHIATAAANGNGATLSLNGATSANGSIVIDTGNRVLSTVAVGATIANTRLRVGLHSEAANNTRPVSGVWWEADSSTNANWNYCYGNGTVATCTPTTVAVAANSLAALDIQVTAVGTGTSAATFRINGTAFTVNAVTIDTTNKVSPAIACYNSVAAVRDCYVDYFQFSGVANARR